MVNLNILDEFKKEGFTHLESFFSKQLCKETRFEIINYLKDFIIDSSNINNSDFEYINKKKHIKYCQSVFDSVISLRKFLTSELAEIAAELLEVSKVYLAGVEIHVRNSGGGEIPLHQDNISFCLKGSKALTAYIVLDKQEFQTGGLGYLPTHSGGEMLNHLITEIPGFSSAIEEKKEYKPIFIFPKHNIGDVTFHHCQTPHLAYPRPLGLDHSYAISPRYFSCEDTIDMERFKNYQANLKKHRNS